MERWSALRVEMPVNGGSGKRSEWAGSFHIPRPAAEVRTQARCTPQCSRSMKQRTTSGSCLGGTRGEGADRTPVVLADDQITLVPRRNSMTMRENSASGRFRSIATRTPAR